MTLRPIGRRTLALLSLAILALAAPVGATATGAPVPAQQPSYLFSVEAAHGTTTILKPRGTTERMTITLEHVLALITGKKQPV